MRSRTRRPQTRRLRRGQLIFDQVLTIASSLKVVHIYPNPENALSKSGEAGGDLIQLQKEQGEGEKKATRALFG